MAIRILVFWWGLIVSGFSISQDNGTSGYAIGSGDTIVISVYNEKDLFVRTQVDISGKVKFPLIGEIEVANKTPSILEREIEAELFDGYLVNPDVSVMVEKYRPFYVKGAVKLPGAYEFRLNLTVEQAIAIGGGLRDRASKSSWYIVNGADQVKHQVTKSDLVSPGDILHIEESIF
ncbi:polysaccharide biosynthesis/export family protein [Aliiglaciecola sp. M165]|uniref:polysaccharide biosynthesis/export family protein n=1 Tax=Aliiglaciecola sp. M165 TaxID=2593649 RepID=UPI00117D0A6F|nr:polysaccharide biosynthesis/export family protein [Aliiglaciecola sp. M165]TRY32065.1 polysaccharide export protein [Aliiglaciecola sp. M165]